MLLRRVFFVNAPDGPAYARAVGEIRGAVGRGDCSELWSVVAQAPYDAQGRPLPLAWEDQELVPAPGTEVSRRTWEGIPYILLTCGSVRELLLGVGRWNCPLPARIPDQPAHVFGIVRRILEHEGFPVDSIRRQWNYVEGITAETEGIQHYQALNDARSAFYAASSWPGGYPAATGIGCASGGFGVEVYAATGVETRAIDNPLQIAAHRYSEAVLRDGAQRQKTTPKFERAREIRVPGRPDACLVSGTAAIRAEASLAGMDAAAQTRATLENIAALLRQVSGLGDGADRADLSCLGALRSARVYVKHPEDIPSVAAVVERACPSARAVYLAADVCRPELLVEIEGFAC